MPYQDKPSEKMQIALRNYRIPEEQIQKMTFEQARAKLNELIEASKARKAKTTQASTSTGAGESGAAPLYHADIPKQAAPLNAQEQVEQRLMTAKAILKRQMPDAENYAEYNAMVIEVLRQLSSEQWLEIEKRKMQNK